jgi:glycerophosphoryl diester phosphodiesterase
MENDLNFVATTINGGIPFDWQGHRGARGLFPENSIPGFIGALSYPIKTLELDVVVSADGELIVSHEPWFSSEICSFENGEQLSIFKMNTADIQRIDCGSKGNIRFPQQKQQPAYKPTLDEVVKAVFQYCDSAGIPYPQFNIELKSRPDWDSVFTPDPTQFVELVLTYIINNDLLELTTLQSFDPRIINEIHKANKLVKTSFLVEYERNVQKALSLLDQRPTFYSPHFSLLTKSSVRLIHALHMKVIPWTVNDTSTMQKLIDMGVDGIITDYPNLIDRLKD